MRRRVEYPCNRSQSHPNGSYAPPSVVTTPGSSFPPYRVSDPPLHSAGENTHHRRPTISHSALSSMLVSERGSGFSPPDWPARLRLSMLFTRGHILFNLRGSVRLKRELPQGIPYEATIRKRLGNWELCLNYWRPPGPAEAKTHGAGAVYVGIQPLAVDSQMVPYENPKPSAAPCRIPSDPHLGRPSGAIPRQTHYRPQWPAARTSRSPPARADPEPPRPLLFTDGVLGCPRQVVDEPAFVFA